MDMNTARLPLWKRLDPVTSIFFSVTPLVAVFGTWWYARHYGVTWLEIANFVLMFCLTLLAVTGGYHRYYAHRTYDCGRLLQCFYLFFGAAAAQQSALVWASDHRDHHRFVDTDDDPYNIIKGAFYAHIGWILIKSGRSRPERFKNAPDLLKNPLVAWQDRWYVPLLIVSAFGVPACIGWIGGRPLGGLLWGGFARMVVAHHSTFFINSLAHLWGTRPYTVDNTARDNWALAPITFGEGYHNFHHAFPGDYRNGIKWYQFDMGKWWIGCMSWLGLARGLHRTPAPAILAAKLTVEMRKVERKLAEAGAPQRLWEGVQFRLHEGRRRLEAAMAQYHAAVVQYRREKDRWSKEARRKWAGHVAYYKAEFLYARAQWRRTLRSMNRFPQPSAQGILTLTAVLDVLRNRFLS